MHKKIQTFLFISSVLLLQAAYAQETSSSDDAAKRAPREFAIPTSPLFDLMGQAPSQVASTAAIKDFKVDWSFKNWRVNPNLAIQAQPIWELFYNKKQLDKYQRASRVQRMLASLDVSIGSVQAETGDRRIGGALKMSLYRSKDPLMVKGAYDEVQQTFAAELQTLKENEQKILKELDSISNPTALLTTRALLRENDVQLATHYSRRNAAIQIRAKEFIAANWNASFVDVAFGKIYSYGTDSAGSLKSLRINRNSGNGVWLNAGTGVGKRGLISALVRSTFYEEEVNFLVRDEATVDETNATTIAANKLITLGLNLRYGGPVYNFFAEIIYEGKSITTPVEAVNKAFTAPAGSSIISSTVNWDVVHPYTVNFGGDWRISRNLVLNYGMRWLMDNNYKTISFTPIANLSCMMR